jgi:pimeloyl-ACP methyl ester carboxylesterase
LPGHGLSQPYKYRKYSFPRFVRTLKEILAKNDIQAPILVGNSTGGMVALKYGAERPRDVTSIVAVSSCDASPVKQNPHIDGAAMIKARIIQSRRLFRKQKLFDYSKQASCQEEISLAGLHYTSPEAIEGNMKAVRTFDIRSKLRNIKVPVLLFRGSKDVIVTRKWMEMIKRRIPRSKLLTLNGCGHHALLENPKLILEGIRRNYSFLLQK